MTLYTLETIHLYQDELLREAEAQRLVQEALAERRAHSPLWQWLRREDDAQDKTQNDDDTEKHPAQPTFSVN